jgi:hypothetical protein
MGCLSTHLLYFTMSTERMELFIIKIFLVIETLQLFYSTSEIL